MTQKSKLNIFLILVSAFVISLLIGILSYDSIKTGNDFDYSTKLILQTSKEKELRYFFDVQARNGIESSVENIDETTYLVVLGGLDDEKTFYENLNTSIPDLNMLHEATFGSEIKRANIEQFLSLYMTLFLFITIVYLSYRYKFFGLIVSLNVVSSVLLSLYFTRWLGYAFTRSIWYAMLISYMMLVYQKQVYLSDYSGNSIRQVVATEKNFQKKYWRNSLIYMSFFGILAILCFAYGDYGLKSAAYYLIAFASISFFNATVYNLVMIPFFASLTDYEGLLTFKMRTQTNFERFRKRRFDAVVIVFFVLVMVSGVFYYTHDRTRNLGEVNHGNYLIIENCETPEYLEAQALLHRIGLYDFQVNSEHSNDHDIWIQFDQEIPLNSMDFVVTKISTELNLKTAFYHVDRGERAVSTPELINIVLIFISVSWLFVGLNYDLRDTLFIPALSFLTLGLFYIFKHIFNISDGYDTLFTAASIPFIEFSYYSSYKRIISVQDPELFKRDFLDSLSLSLTMFLIMGVPIMMMVPNELSNRSLFLIFILLFSAYFALLLIYFLSMFIRKLALKYGKK